MIAFLPTINQGRGKNDGSSAVCWCPCHHHDVIVIAILPSWNSVIRVAGKMND